MRFKFIINRHCGAGLTDSYIRQMENFFVRDVGRFDHVCPADREESITETRRALKEGYDRIVAVGGDGTVNSVLNGFFEGGRPINPQAALIPARLGSGHDFYRGVAHGSDLMGWMDLVTNHTPMPVDVGLVTFAVPEVEPRYFANMASVGMSADIVRHKDLASKNIPRVLAYLIPTLKALFYFTPKPLVITVDDRELRATALTTLISKGRFAGGGMRMGLHVLPDDGRFEVTVIAMSSPWRLLLRVPQLFTGGYETAKEVQKLYGSKVSISCEAPLQVELDGELYGTTDFEVELLPKAVQVGFPWRASRPSY